MNKHHGVHRYIDRTLRVAHPESMHTVPDNFIQGKFLLDTDSRVTPNSLFEHQLDDTSMFYHPQERIVSMRERNGQIVEAPKYLRARLQKLRDINKYINYVREFDDYVDQFDAFPNGPFRDALYAQHLENQEKIMEAMIREARYINRGEPRF